MFQNLHNIKIADEVWVAWDENTRGGLFDLGCAVALNKPISLIHGLVLVFVVVFCCDFEGVKITTKKTTTFSILCTSKY